MTYEGWRGEVARGLVAGLQHIYQRCRYSKTPAWGYSNQMLLDLPKASLGYVLGVFLTQHGFSLMPSFERHDVFHIMLGYGVTVLDEIQMQYCLAGNGRLTAPTLAVMLIGAVLYPKHFPRFMQHYRQGKHFVALTGVDFYSLLHDDFLYVKFKYTRMK